MFSYAPFDLSAGQDSDPAGKGFTDILNHMKHLGTSQIIQAVLRGAVRPSRVKHFIDIDFAFWI